MEDFPWVPIAMVFIAFLSWLRNRIQEAGEIRRQRRAQREAAAHSRRTSEPAEPVYESPYRESTAPEGLEDIPKTFRELFDEINSQQEIVPEPEPAPTRRYQPPPLPPSVSQAESVDTIEDDSWNTESNFSSFESPTSPPVVSPPIKKKKRRQSRHPIATVLSEKDQLRTALILNEILNPPKALQHRQGR